MDTLYLQSSNSKICSAENGCVWWGRGRGGECLSGTFGSCDKCIGICFPECGLYPYIFFVCLLCGVCTCLPFYIIFASN